MGCGSGVSSGGKSMGQKQGRGGGRKEGAEQAARPRDLLQSLPYPVDFDWDDPSMQISEGEKWANLWVGRPGASMKIAGAPFPLSPLPTAGTGL